MLFCLFYCLSISKIKRSWFTPGVRDKGQTVATREVAEVRWTSISIVNLASSEAYRIAGADIGDFFDRQLMCLRRSISSTCFLRSIQGKKPTKVVSRYGEDLRRWQVIYKEEISISCLGFSYWVQGCLITQYASGKTFGVVRIVRWWSQSTPWLGIGANAGYASWASRKYL
jgi:hypothetical protein